MSNFGNSGTDPYQNRLLSKGKYGYQENSNNSCEEDEISDHNYVELSAYLNKNACARSLLFEYLAGVIEKVTHEEQEAYIITSGYGKLKADGLITGDHLIHYEGHWNEGVYTILPPAVMKQIFKNICAPYANIAIAEVYRCGGIVYQNGRLENVDNDLKPYLEAACVIFQEIDQDYENNGKDYYCEENDEWLIVKEAISKFESWLEDHKKLDKSSSKLHERKLAQDS